MKTLKTLNYDVWYGYRSLWSTPNISIGFTKQCPFADWSFDFHFEFLCWFFRLTIDNFYKYYPKYKAE